MSSRSPIGHTFRIHPQHGLGLYTPPLEVSFNGLSMFGAGDSGSYFAPAPILTPSWLRRRPRLWSWTWRGEWKQTPGEGRRRPYGRASNVREQGSVQQVGDLAPLRCVQPAAGLHPQAGSSGEHHSLQEPDHGAGSWGECEEAPTPCWPEVDGHTSMRTSGRTCPTPSTARTLGLGDVLFECVREGIPAERINLAQGFDLYYLTRRLTPH